MNRIDIRQRVERSLQDTENKRWTDSEINQYIDDSHLEFVRLSKYPQVEQEIDLISSSISTTSTAAVDNNTIVVTTKDGNGAAIVHGLSTGDAVRVKTGTSNINLTYIVTVLTTSTFRILREDPDQSEYIGPDNLLEVIKLGPSYLRPTTMTEIISISYDERELLILTEEDLNKASTRIVRTNGVRNLLKPYSLVPSVRSYTDIPRWREENGSPVSAILRNRSASTFRVFPLPYEDEDLYLDKDASTKYSRVMKVRGVKKISGLTSDSSEPEIEYQYREGLVWGTLERAYLKETQMRNIEKSQMFRQRFLAVVLIFPAFN